MSISVQILSFPGAFTDFICCIACVTSCSEVLSPSISLGFLCCQRIPLFVLDIVYNCLGVSAELVSQSINCTYFSSFCSSSHFNCSIAHMSSLVVPCRALFLVSLFLILYSLLDSFRLGVENFGIDSFPLFDSPPCVSG